jgi:hypothetical protein
MTRLIQVLIDDYGDRGAVTQTAAPMQQFRLESNSRFE